MDVKSFALGSLAGLVVCTLALKLLSGGGKNDKGKDEDEMFVLATPAKEVPSTPAAVVSPPKTAPVAPPPAVKEVKAPVAVARNPIERAASHIEHQAQEVELKHIVSRLESSADKLGEIHVQRGDEGKREAPRALP